MGFIAHRGSVLRIISIYKLLLNYLLFFQQEWSLVFGSYTPVLDSSAPLWFATYNSVEVRSTDAQINGLILMNMTYLSVVDNGHQIWRVSEQVVKS